MKARECSREITSYREYSGVPRRTDSSFSKLHICGTEKVKRGGTYVCFRVQYTDLNNRLAFVAVVALVLVPEQRLVALHLVRPGTHGARGGGENGCDDHQGSYYRYGDDFSQGERLT